MRCPIDDQRVIVVLVCVESRSKNQIATSSNDGKHSELLLVFKLVGLQERTAENDSKCLQPACDDAKQWW